ncbi:hypothetical protein BGX23_005417, partial [Mortierella sp. AD031]
MSRLENLVTQDQFQSLASMISRLENAVMDMHNEVSRQPAWTERSIDIREWAVLSTNVSIPTQYGAPLLAPKKAPPLIQHQP